jgi:hypothetical protein
MHGSTVELTSTAISLLTLEKQIKTILDEEAGALWA